MAERALMSDLLSGASPPLFDESNSLFEEVFEELLPALETPTLLGDWLGLIRRGCSLGKPGRKSKFPHQLPGGCLSPAPPPPARA